MNKLINKIKNNAHSYVATILGLIVAIASAWLDIEWSNFDITKEWPKLLLSAIIAIGGYLSSIKMLIPKNKIKNE